MLDNSTSPLDPIDQRLIGALREHPKASMKELARGVGVARGTIYSRLERLERLGVITGYGPDIDAGAAGYNVLAFCTLEIAQGSHTKTVTRLSAIPEIVEIHTITGAGDLLVRVLARSNDHLHDVLQTITALATVLRSQTQLALSSQKPRSVAEIVAAANQQD